ncbi:hypothetical protein OXX79_007898 [Metschnikowia pulcherrima]
MRLLHSKHQKLILQCYPPGKGVDKKPNPSELSYLLYYASTRRVKLEKVIEFLKRKTRADARSRKSGNLSVTLSIVSALIEKCFENLNAFAPQVCSILSTILALKELPLCKALAATYCVFCAKLDNGLFTGDKEFVDAFSRLTSDLIALAESQSSVQATNKREWKMISLLTCRHVFSCLGYNAQLSGKFVPLTVAILAPTVSRAFSLENLNSRLRTSLNVESGGERLLAKIATAKSVPAESNAESLDEDSLTDQDLGEEALSGLRTLFHTSLSHQINRATRSVVELDFTRDQGKNSASAWGTTFLQVCASYIPVQLRFETLLTLLDTLSSIASGADSFKFLHMRHYAKYIRSLVSSGFNMIGLSISDILVQFLTLKTNLYVTSSEKLTASEVAELSSIYSECICNLSSHIYYFDQVSDSIEGILMQVDNVLLTAEKSSAEKVGSLVLDLLSLISKIMELLSSDSSAISWNHATLENWEISFQLLTFSKSYPRYAEIVSPLTVRRIQREYLQVVQSFLDRELYTKSTKQDQSENIDAAAMYLEPNYRNYVEDKHNALDALLVQCGGYFEDKFFEQVNTRALARIISVIAGITGVNFAHNFFSHFTSWQLQRSTDIPALVARDLCAYHVLTMTLSAINEKYQDMLGEDIANSHLCLALLKDIHTRRRSLWGVANHGMTQGPEVIHSKQISIGQIESFFARTTLKQWLVSPNTILVEFQNGDGQKFASPAPDTATDLRPDDASLASILPYPGSSLGLGTANDISSIYSGLQNGHANGASNGKAREVYTPDTSQLTHVTNATHRTQNADPHSLRRLLLPRVEDLKHSVEGTHLGDKFSTNGGEVSSARSIFQKQPRVTDVASILADLNSDDDRNIVV